LVVSAGPPCSVGREVSWSQQKIKAWSLGFTCMCGVGLLAMSSKLISLWCLWSSKTGGLELSGAHKVVEALESTCAGALASRSYSSCCSHGGAQSAGTRNSKACLPGAGAQYSSATGIEDSSLQAAGALGAACQCWFPGVTTASEGMENQSFGQQEFWGLLAGHGLPGSQFSSAVGMGS
jgi:hypothetical protein